MHIKQAISYFHHLMIRKKKIKVLPWICLHGRGMQATCIIPHHMLAFRGWVDKGKMSVASLLLLIFTIDNPVEPHSAQEAELIPED